MLGELIVIMIGLSSFSTTNHIISSASSYISYHLKYCPLCQFPFFQYIIDINAIMYILSFHLFLHAMPLPNEVHFNYLDSKL